MKSSGGGKVAITIKTYLREGCIETLIDSIERFCNVPYRLYIADELPISESKEKLYERLKEEGHFIYVFTENAPIAVTVARNFLLTQLLDEEFVLRLDDDFVFFEKTNLMLLRSLLECRPELGAVSGVEIQGNRGKRVSENGLSPGQGHIQIDRRNALMIRRLCAVDTWHWLEANSIRFAYADFTRNFLLLRRVAVDSVRWNEKLIIDGEHIDFMLRLRECGWGLAFTPDSVHYHLDPPKKKVALSYLRSRNSLKGHRAMLQVFHDQWGIREIMAVSTSLGRDPSVLFERLKRYVKNVSRNVRMKR